MPTYGEGWQKLGLKLNDFRAYRTKNFADFIGNSASQDGVIKFREYTAGLATGLLDDTIVEVAICAHMFRLNIAVQYTRIADLHAGSTDVRSYHDPVYYFKGAINPTHTLVAFVD